MGKEIQKSVSIPAVVLSENCHAQPTETTEKHFCFALADSNCQCIVVLHHELVWRAAADRGAALPDGAQSTQALRLLLGDFFRVGRWL